MEHAPRRGVTVTRYRCHGEASFALGLGRNRVRLHRAVNVTQAASFYSARRTRGVLRGAARRGALFRSRRRGPGRPRLLANGRRACPQPGSWTEEEHSRCRIGTGAIPGHGYWDFTVSSVACEFGGRSGILSGAGVGRMVVSATLCLHAFKPCEWLQLSCDCETRRARWANSQVCRR